MEVTSVPTEDQLFGAVDALLEQVAQDDLPSPAERRRLREAAGLSQDQIAKALSTRREAVGNWEAGRTKPRPPKRAAYARLLEGLAARFPAPEATARLSPPRNPPPLLFRTRRPWPPPSAPRPCPRSPPLRSRPTRRRRRPRILVRGGRRTRHRARRVPRSARRRGARSTPHPRRPTPAFRTAPSLWSTPPPTGRCRRTASAAWSSTSPAPPPSPSPP
ncbi:helix-turn-helix transcriptional regulator [Streptomyces sp. NPDC023723]|uniref:helix-turn-helix transcriptional regulator n=1 Tax=Streptomyces sp. NPDC023723 TaxID=3154323 RepID=UPI0034045357